MYFDMLATSWQSQKVEKFCHLFMGFIRTRQHNTHSSITDSRAVLNNKAGAAEAINKGKCVIDSAHQITDAIWSQDDDTEVCSHGWRHPCSELCPLLGMAFDRGIIFRGIINVASLHHGQPTKTHTHTHTHTHTLFLSVSLSHTNTPLTEADPGYFQGTLTNLNREHVRAWSAFSCL